MKHKTIYKFDNYPEYEDIIKKIALNTYSLNNENPLCQELINNIELFIATCMNLEYIKKDTIKVVLERLKQINSITLFEDFNEKNIYINPNLSKNERQFLLFQELASIIIDNKCYIDLICDYYFKLEESNGNNLNNNVKTRYIKYGFNVIEKVIIEELAENCFYSLNNLERPTRKTTTESETLGNIFYSTNLLHYGVFQDLTSYFGRTIMGVGFSNSTTDDQILKNLCSYSLQNNFIKNIIIEYGCTLGIKVFMIILGLFGVVYAKKININDKDLTIEETKNCYKDLTSILKGRFNYDNKLNTKTFKLHM